MSSSSTQQTSRVTAHPAAHPVERFIATAPMPLAQLARRARNAKTGTAVLQNAAHYLGEAGAALAASYWLARCAMAHDGRPGEVARKQARALLGRGASLGAWVGLWRESAAATEGHALAALSQPFDDISSIEALISALDQEREALGEDGDDLLAALRSARKRGVLGVFEFLAMFRNKVYGHGTMLAESSCQRLAVPFLSVVVHALSRECVFEGAWLGRTALDLLSDGDDHYWLELHGVSESAAAGHRAAPAAATVTPGVLYFVREDRAVPLEFWVVQDEDATGLSRFGFLQRPLRRRKRGQEDIHGAEYLDYLGGRFRHDVQLETLRARTRDWFAAPDGNSGGNGGGNSDNNNDGNNKGDQGEAGGDQGEAGGEAGGAESPRSANERRFGDFVIESEIGRGAMGIVYRATQLSLGRQVALKVLPPALLGDPIALGRFHREIQALGRCDHRNVVRVLASGVEEGRPWFAMELVEGADLSDVFATLAEWKGVDTALRAIHLSAASSSAGARRRADSRRHHQDAARAADPAAGLARDKAGDTARERGAPATDAAVPGLPVASASILTSGPTSGPASASADPGQDIDLYQRLAELFAEAAEGVEEIHRRGLVHRDLKPANIMLAADGERLVIMDLGLAKMSDISVSFTRQSGSDFVGSARYAAPEQLQAKLLVVDHRADVYSLGATLYELVTLRALYPASELAELLRHKLSEDPAPARSLDRAIPRDLEIILQKSLARRPEDRYASAGEMAADLRAFAEHRPIQARPPSPYEYLLLFYHRQRRFVQLFTAALVLLFGVAVASFVMVTSERSRALVERDNAQRERDNAQRERDRAESLAGFVFDDLYQRLAPMGKIDLFQDVTARMVDYYHSRDLEDPDVAVRYAEALRRAGEADHQQGQVATAREKYQAARDILFGLRERGQGGVAAHAALAHTYSDLAGADFNQNRLDEGLANASAALDIRRALVDTVTENQVYQRALAESYRQVGVAMERKGDLQQALGAYRNAVEYAERVKWFDEGGRLTLTELAMNRMSVGDTLDTLGQSQSALSEFQLARDTLLELSHGDPLDTKVSRQLATNHDSIAGILLRMGEFEGALEQHQSALAIRERLVRHDPGRASWQRDLAASHANIGRIRELEGKLIEARAAYQQSLELIRALAERDPSNVRWQMDVGIGQNTLGRVLHKQGARNDALVQYRESLATSERVVTNDPSNAEYEHHASVCHGLIAEVLAEQGKTTQALESVARQRAILEHLVERDAKNLTWHSDLVKALHMTGVLLERTGAHREALAELNIALERQSEAGVPVALGTPEWRAQQRARAEIQKVMGLAHAALGERDAAREVLGKARALFERLDGPEASTAREVERHIARLDRPKPVGRPATQAEPVPETPSIELEPIQSKSRKADIYE